MSASTNEHYLMAFLNMNAESGQHPLDVCAGQSIGYEQHLMPLYSIGYEQHLIAPNAEPWIGYEQYPMTLLNMNTEPWIEYEQYPMTLLNMNTEPWIEYEQYPMTLLNMNTEPWIGYEPSIGIGPYSIISHDMYVEPLIDTNEFLQHSISHISLAPNKHTKPSIDIRNGQHVLSVPQAGIFYHQLPPTNSPEFQKILRCNSFIMYRRCIHKVLKGSKTVFCSKLAKETWKSADEKFREFFRKYAKDVISKKNKIYKIVINKRGKSKRKSTKGLSVDQEVHMQQEFQAQSTYQIRSMKPIENI